MNIPVVVVATFYSGMPPEQIETDITSRFERFFTLGSGIEHIESRSLPGRERHQGLLPAGHQPRFRRHHDLQSGDGAAAAPAAGHAAAGRAEVRRLEPAGLPGHAQGRGPERNRSCATWRSSRCATRSPACPGASVPQPFGGTYRQIMVYVDPLQAGSAPAEPDGRGARGQRLQSDSAGRRRADRAARLQHLHQQPAAHRRRDQPAAAQDGGPGAGARRRHRLRQGRASRSRPTSCAWTASARSTCRC